MSTKKSQNTASIINPNITSLKTNSNESKYLNNEVDDKVQKIQQSSKHQDDDDEDLSDLANGGWEDDFTDNEEDDVESRKEWETLEFLCQISKTRLNKNDSYKDGDEDVENGNDDIKGGNDDIKGGNDDVKNGNDDIKGGDVKNGIDSKNDSSIIDGNPEEDDNDYDDDRDNGSNDSAVERNGTEKNIKDSEDNENNENNKIKHNEIISSSIPAFSDVSDPLANNIEQPSSIPQSNIENRNRKRRSSENDNEIGVGTLQKTKKPKDDSLEIEKVHK
ncbi:hypothetical protein RclHR1_14580003 [Rhizophagus clarus]|uniref:Uncharacterized protein n=1 Tax=Rhizophagus clarus TaxID=94130 RepID=A0A2Z6R5M5_9GLOM|nr:hypothetical protein RclHR1_14580003 [Rhizophagus clarus]GES97805.1 hypothetical protein GLOIN_2v1514917 [Rhizophagus clarus]